jgi:hypothetical protein
MRFRTLALAIAFLACASISHGGIISYNIADDGDGVVVCGGYEKTYGTPQPSVAVDITGSHNVVDPLVGLQAGHIQGFIETDEFDPTLTISNAIDNDTGYAWTGYNVEVKMSKSFTLSAVTVDGGWTSVYNPIPVGSSGLWTGTINYTGGTVPSGETLTFGYAVTYVGKGSTSLHQTMTPVPEPGTLAMLACGLVCLLVARRRYAR